MTQIKLPTLPNSMPPKPPPFAVGGAVLLKAAPFEVPGTVLRVERGKILVRWSDLRYVGRHKVNTLIAASAPLNCAANALEARGGGDAVVEDGNHHRRASKRTSANSERGRREL